MNVDQSYGKFPTTRYQGSKRKIISWLYQHFEPLEFTNVLDAFGGTGAVSYLFKSMGKEVTYNDELKFNSIIGSALIENSNVILSEDDLKTLTELDNINVSKPIISKYFSGVYFTDEENFWIDKYIQNLKNISYNSISERNYKKSLALFALFQASMTKRPYNLFHRKNLYMRLNDVERNFGNKTTWEKPFETQVKKFALEANESIFSGARPCRSLNKDVFSLENEDYDLVYIDPPYVDLNGDHDTVDYLYCYHFLEGISNYNNWEDFIDFESINLRFKKEFHTNRFKNKNVLESFEKLFHKFQNSIIVISYKKNGVPSIESIENLLSKFKPNVKLYSKHYSYALNKQNGNAMYNREVLIIGE